MLTGHEAVNGDNSKQPLQHQRKRLSCWLCLMLVELFLHPQDMTGEASL